MNTVIIMMLGIVIRAIMPVVMILFVFNLIRKAVR